MKKITVFINNRNRISTLISLINWLRDKSIEIVILDNDSDYPPLIEYYKSVDCEIIKLGKNLGHTALYKWGKHLNYEGRYFIYTDSDLVPNKDCPKDLIDYLIFSKKKYQQFDKIGVSLEIEDIPDWYLLKKDVIEWESQFWEEKFEDFYIANVDTTFAIYDKLSKVGKSHSITNCLRTKRPYVMRHEPWYLDINNLSEEERYYLRSTDAVFNGKFVGMWTQKHKKLYAQKYKRLKNKLL